MFSRIASLAAAGLGLAEGLAMPIVNPSPLARTRYPTGYKPSRWTNRYMPHQGEREIARRLRKEQQVGG